MIKRTALCLLLGMTLVVCVAFAGDEKLEVSKTKVEVSGTFAPAGPPLEPPKRAAAGNGCIIELTQPYKISGALSGSLDIDYRIIVFGPCGTPPGTDSEEWIAHGKFVGSINDVAASGAFSYLADVKVGGEVDGRIVFGQGLEGELRVVGSFEDGKLSYTGWVK